MTENLNDDKTRLIAKKEEVFQKTPESEAFMQMHKDFMGVCKHYVMDMDKNLIVCDDLFNWGMWMEKEGNTRVALTEKRKIKVSTVFLGLDHNFGMVDDEEPILFETMIFGKGFEDMEYQTRCSTYPIALKMHQEACEYAFRSLWRRLIDWMKNFFDKGEQDGE